MSAGTLPRIKTRLMFVVPCTRQCCKIAITLKIPRIAAATAISREIGSLMIRLLALEPLDSGCLE
jgi:hypothetical protein